jgi:hypothetical protein
MIQYRETEPGTLVGGDGDRDIPSHGRVWIDSATGRFLRTELISEDMSIRAAIDVSYKSEPGLDLLVPGEMRELYLLRRTESRIDGRAEYSRFRRFTVTTTEKPKQQGSRLRRAWARPSTSLRARSGSLATLARRLGPFRSS